MTAVASSFKAYVNKSSHNIGGMDGTTAKTNIEGVVSSMSSQQQFLDVCTLPNDDATLIADCRALSNTLPDDIYDKLAGGDKVDLSMMPIILDTIPYSATSGMQSSSTGTNNTEASSLAVGNTGIAVQIAGNKWCTIKKPSQTDRARVVMMHDHHKDVSNPIIVMNDTNNLFLFTHGESNSKTGAYCAGPNDNDRRYQMLKYTFTPPDPTPQYGYVLELTGCTIVNKNVVFALFSYVSPLSPTPGQTLLQIYQASTSLGQMAPRQHSGWAADSTLPTNTAFNTTQQALVRDTQYGGPMICCFWSIESSNTVKISYVDTIGPSTSPLALKTMQTLIPAKQMDRSIVINIVGSRHVAVASHNPTNTLFLHVVGIIDGVTTRVMTSAGSSDSFITAVHSRPVPQIDGMENFIVLILVRDSNINNTWRLLAGQFGWKKGNAPAFVDVVWTVVSNDVTRLYDGFNGLTKNNRLILLGDDIITSPTTSPVSLFSPAAAGNNWHISDITDDDMAAKKVWWLGSNILPFIEDKPISATSPHGRYRYVSNSVVEQMYGDIRLDVKYVNVSNIVQKHGVTLSNRGRVRSADSVNVPEFDNNFTDGYSVDGDKIATMKVELNKNMTMPSPNGIYVILWQNNTLRVYRNIYNTSDFYAWTQIGSSSRYSQSLSSMAQFCNDSLTTNPGDALTMTDNYCYCVPNVKLFNSIFNVNALTPSDTARLLTQTPCITVQCATAAVDPRETIASVYRKNTCMNSITLCSNVIKSNNSIMDTVNVNQNCGGGTTIGCKKQPNLCVVGETCLNDICVKSCLNDSSCRAGMVCKNGACVNPSTGSSLSAGAIAGIVIGCVVVLAIVIGVPVYFRLRKK